MAIRKPNTTTIRLKIGLREVVFGLLSTLEFALEGRLDVPTKRVRLLLGMGVDQLDGEAKRIEQLHKDLVPIARAASQDADGADKPFHAIPIHRLCQEHGWWEIFAALDEKDNTYNEARALVLSKYLQYLTNHRELIAQISLWSQQQKHPAELEPVGDHTLSYKAFMALRDGTAGKGDKALNGAMGYVPLSKTEALRIPLREGLVIPIRLAERPFTIFFASDLWLRNESSRTTEPLHVGVNIIGRGDVCDIILDPSYHDISRRHLKIDVSLKKDAIYLLDLSTHGSFVSGEVEVVAKR
jgi:hypothetical protein